MPLWLPGCWQAAVQLFFGMLVALAGKLSEEGKAPESTGCAHCPLAASCSKLSEKDHGKEAAH